jgi:para-aminobenzoate synthetase/4-amino-4-deoxychorismate lyase
MRPVFALLDETAPEGHARARSRLYTGHAGTLACHDADAWPQLLARLEEMLEAGLHAVPVLTYELGAHRLGVPARALDGAPNAPLAQVLLFERYEALDAPQVDAWLRAQAAAEADGSETPAGVAALRANLDQAAFTRAIGHIRDQIAAGDTYQVNYTYRLRFDAFGSMYSLYARLRARQPVPYGALIALPDGRAVVSLSPELFVRHDAGRLLARPMKGTARAADGANAEAEAENAVRARALAEDPKNRAENLMIVDLLRNDLGRVAETGSVGVPALFEVRRYGSVLQMTSTIQAQLRRDATLAEVFDALYPCGSITGAPKHRTMQIIHDLEPAPRGLYTGALGWIEPPSSSLRTPSPSRLGDFCLSVPIRTLTLNPPRDGVRHGEMGVGAGIVYDSDAAAEWEECRLKARFLSELPNDFEIFETMYATRDGGCRHLERHVARLQASCAYFGHRFDAARARAAALHACAGLADGPQRLRLAVKPDGDIAVQTGALAPLSTPPTEPVQLLLADRPMRSDDLFLRHKTSIRSRYDAAWRAAEGEGAFDTLFFNERDELTEGGRSNVFVRIGGRWLTPPLSSGLLPAVLLDDPAWAAMACPISRAMLLRAQEIVVCNALRGPLRAVLRQ